MLILWKSLRKNIALEIIKNNFIGVLYSLITLTFCYENIFLNKNYYISWFTKFQSCSLWHCWYQCNFVNFLIFVELGIIDNFQLIFNPDNQ